MSFFSNIFGTTSTPPQNTSTQTATTTQTPLSGTSTQTIQAQPENKVDANMSPLDDFKALWEPVTTKEVDGTLPANMFAGADPAKMLEAARKVDFAKSVPPEVLAKITAGGPEAAAAFAAAINDVAQRSYAQSSFASTKIVEAALAKFQEGLESRLPSQIKKHQVSDSLRELNPALTHPAAAPIMEALQSQFSVKYPNATTNELRDMASDYLTKFAGVITPPKKEAKTPVSEDWDKFFS